eukprot:3390606-Pleurochrysis_carterae.AAC.1
MAAGSAAVASARLPALAATLGSSFFERLLQSRCQCLPPQCRHVPKRGDQALSKVFGRSARLGSPFLCALSFDLRAPLSA